MNEEYNYCIISLYRHPQYCTTVVHVQLEFYSDYHCSIFGTMNNLNGEVKFTIVDRDKSAYEEQESIIDFCNIQEEQDFQYSVYWPYKLKRGCITQMQKWVHWYLENTAEDQEVRMHRKVLKY